jgi:hypothetical protein
VRIEDMRESYWVKRFTGARRVPQINGNELNNNPAPWDCAEPLPRPCPTIRAT